MNDSHLDWWVPQTGHRQAASVRIGAAGAAGVLLGGTGGPPAAARRQRAAGTTPDGDHGRDHRRRHEPGHPPAGGGALDKLRLGFAYIGPINDNGWTQEHHRGRQAVFDALGDKVEGTYVENVLFDPAETTPIFEDLASNHDIVIANTEYATLLSDVAANHPDVHFLECDGHTYTGQPVLVLRQAHPADLRARRRRRAAQRGVRLQDRLHRRVPDRHRLQRRQRPAPRRPDDQSRLRRCRR